MIDTNDYIGYLIAIITAAVFEIFKKKNPLVLSSVLIIILTIIYKFNIITSHIASLFSNYTLFLFNDFMLTELKLNKFFLIILSSIIMHLLVYDSLKYECEMEEAFRKIKFNKKYLFFSILFSFFITIYLNTLSSYLIINKLYFVINNKYIITFIYGFLLGFIIFFETWILFRINLYLSFKKTKHK